MRSGLVVDESPIVRRVLGIMLERLGFAIVEAETSDRAVALCQESLPDIALIRWTLPDDDGITLVQQLRRLPGGEKIKLIICTSDRSVTQIEAALAAGADQYVTKPFGIETLRIKLGYLGFELPPEPADSLERRQLSRLGLAGMAVADQEEILFAAGETIFTRGDAPECAYILLQGEVALGEARLQPYSLFGDLALIDNSPRHYNATAISDRRCMRISRGRFQAELGAISPFLQNWLESLADPVASGVVKQSETN